jgi:iron complex transport system substrate-binding protein
VILLFISCNNQPQESTEHAIKVYEPEFAKFFRIEYYPSYKKITILNPWENKELNLNYYLLKDSLSEQMTNNHQNFIIPKAPEKVIALSSPMVGLLSLLHLEDKISGVSDPSYIFNEEILQKIEEGQIANVGKNIAVNMETLLSLQPDLIIGSGWDKLSPDFERMIQLKQTPLLMYDWQELHPLGKAEWMVLLASLFNEEDKAIEQFESLRDRYNELSRYRHFDKQPMVFNGSEYQGIWYSAGGQSYMSQLYRDAGGNYIMKNDSASGSVMLDFEVIMKRAEKTDIWMYTGSTDAASLSLFQTPKYQSFSAVKNHRVFSYHKRINEAGANDYWETASYQPDLVLKDLIRIFHDSKPENMYYFKEVAY